MCGRFTLASPASDVMNYFGIDEIIEFSPRYNIAPSQNILVVRNNQHNKREFVMMRWGFIPKWQKEEDIASKWINARSETIDEKTLFKDAFKHHRCLIVSDGFYEWDEKSKPKQPYYIHYKSSKPFGIAGFWERWESNEGSVIESCALLTTESNALLHSIHHRMPVIIKSIDFDSWLNVGNNDVDDLKHLLRPLEKNSMEIYPVSMAVNSPKNDFETCILPID